MNKFFISLMIILLCNCSSSPAEEILPNDDKTEDTTDPITPPDNDSEGDTTGDPDGTDDYGTSTYDANRPVGFATVGTTPTGGEGGNSIIVTTAAELKNALKKTEKLVIYIKGTITTDNVISLLVTNKTLLGLPGSVLTNPNRTKETSGILYFKKGSDNLILRNITFKSAGAYDTDGRDNLCIDGTTNIWVDHCDFQDGVDGNFDCKNASDNIAVTWCRFRYLIEPLAGGPGGNDAHCFSNLWGNSDSNTADRGHLNTTFQFCWWDEGCRDRMPRVRFARIHIANCLYSSTVSSHCIGAGKEADVYVEKSVFTGFKKDKVFKTYTDDAKVHLDQCISPLTGSEANGTGSSFTPPYVLTTIEAAKVEEAVKGHAGATLTIKEPQ